MGGSFEKKPKGEDDNGYYEFLERNGLKEDGINLFSKRYYSNNI
jgi:hypothetical protein